VPREMIPGPRGTGLRLTQFKQSNPNKNLKTKNMATSQLRHSIHASVQPCGLLLVSLLLTCFAVPQNTQAVVPAPNGGYPGFNTAGGTNALQSLTTGVGNSAVGWYSLFSNTDGSFNTAIGAGTLLSNIGDQSLGNGTQNTAVGTAALLFNNNGYANTAVGCQALLSNTTNSFSTAVGAQALLNSVGYSNTAVGYSALDTNTFGFSNTAVGDNALHRNTTGQYNTTLGTYSGYSLTTGDGNVCIGSSVLGVAGESFTTRIRNIGSTPIVGGITVVVAATGGTGDGKLGYASSSCRYKQEIKPMQDASETLLALKPVTFRAKGAADDTSRVKHYGLIAEEVATVNPDLVVFNPEGQPETLRFDSINAMLLNEFLKEHSRVEKQSCEIVEQRATINELKKEMATVVSKVKEQAAQIQKVSAQIEVTKPAPQVVNNP
jgi:trimeric autotransporter adhesin